MSFKIGLALGGGAARGLAHLGVIKGLQDAEIPIDVIAGTSIGAIIGSIYAESQDIDAVIDNLHSYLHSKDYKKTKLEFIKNNQEQTNSYFKQLKKLVKTGIFMAASIQKSSFISDDEFRNNLECIIPAKNIEDCPVKLGLVATDLMHGTEKIIRTGSLIQGAMASSAIPGIFPPFIKNNETLVDGSWINPVPVRVARELGADFVIAVDVASKMSEDIKADNGLNISLKSAEATRLALKEECLKLADIVLPIDLPEVHWADFMQIDHCIEKGEALLASELEKIKKKIFWHKLTPRSFSKILHH